jgi:spore germination protein KA
MLEQIQNEFKTASDLLMDTLDNGYLKMEIAYFPSLCDERIKDGLLIPFSYRFDPDEFRRMLHSNPKYQKQDKSEEWANLLLKGNVLLEIDGQCYSFKSDRTFVTEVGTTQVEASLQGPQSAFTEDINLNISLVRLRYNKSTLSIKPYDKGSFSRTSIQVLYDPELVNENALKLLLKQMENVKIDLLQASGQLVKELTNKSHRLFPTMLQTERPDRVAVMLRRGKIVILMNGSRFAIVLPVRLFDFMHAMDDDYDYYWVSHFLSVMRYIAMSLTIILPAMYIDRTPTTTPTGWTKSLSWTKKSCASA